MTADERFEAAAMWGMSENPMHGLSTRLTMAQSALKFYGDYYAWVEAQLEDAPEEVWLLEDWRKEHTGKQLVRFHGSEETAADIMEKNPDRFNFVILKSVKFPVEVE